MCNMMPIITRRRLTIEIAKIALLTFLRFRIRGASGVTAVLYHAVDAYIDAVNFTE